MLSQKNRTLKHPTDIDDLILRINKAIEHLEGLQNMCASYVQQIDAQQQRPKRTSIYTREKRFIIIASCLTLAFGIYVTLIKEETLFLGIELCLIAFSVVFFHEDPKTHSASAIHLMDHYLLENEKNNIHKILFDLEITPENYKLSALIALLKQKKKDLVFSKHNPSRKIAFLMGQHSRVGAESDAKKFFFESKNYDENVTDLIFQFAGFSKFSIKEKKEEVKKLLSFSIFNNNENEIVNLINHTEKEKIMNVILSY